MPSRSWIGLAATGCCAAAGLVVPETHKFLSEIWASYLQETLANRLAIGLTVAATFAGPTLNLLWGLREIDALRKDVDAADVRRKEAEGREAKANIKIRELNSEIEASAMHAPDRFLERAILADGGKPSRPEGVSILERGLENAAEPMADACRRLAIKLLAVDDDSDLAEAERVAGIAAALFPRDTDDREIASVIVECQAAKAYMEDLYDPNDPAATPVVTEEIAATPAEAESLVQQFQRGSKNALDNGNFFLAERLAAKAKMISVFGENASLYFVSSFVHAQAVEFLGNYQESLDEIDAYSVRQKNVCGEDHPDVLATRYLRARVLDNLGRHQEALSETDDLSARREKAHGKDHPTVLTTRHLRAKVLNNLRRHQEALDEIDSLSAQEENVFGKDHPLVLITRHLRAGVLDNLNRHQEALGEIDAVSLRQEKVCGKDHPDVLSARYLRARVLNGLGRYQEALDEINAFSAREEKGLGKIHPHVFITRHLRARVLNNLGRHQEALDEINAFYEREKSVCGENHPNVDATRRLRAKVLNDLGRYQKR